MTIYLSVSRSGEVVHGLPDDGGAGGGHGEVVGRHPQQPQHLQYRYCRYQDTVDTVDIWILTMPAASALASSAELRQSVGWKVLCGAGRGRLGSVTWGGGGNY